MAIKYRNKMRYIVPVYRVEIKIQDDYISETEFGLFLKWRPINFSAYEKVVVQYMFKSRIEVEI